MGNISKGVKCKSLAVAVVAVLVCLDVTNDSVIGNCEVPTFGSLENSVKLWHYYRKFL